MARAKRLTKPDEATLAARAAQVAEDNVRVQAFLDRESRGEDPITGAPARRKSTMPWIPGDRQTWIIALIADYERHFQETGNVLFIWAARDASRYLRDSSTHSFAWIDHYLDLINKRLLAGVAEPPHDANAFIAEALGLKSRGRGERSSFSDAQRAIRDGGLALAVMNRLSIERGKEYRAIRHVAAAEGVGITMVGDAWRALKGRRQQQH
jgi:hypothetical protein